MWSFFINIKKYIIFIIISKRSERVIDLMYTDDEEESSIELTESDLEFVASSDESASLYPCNAGVGRR